MGHRQWRVTTVRGRRPWGHLASDVSFCRPPFPLQWVPEFHICYCKAASSHRSAWSPWREEDGLPLRSVPIVRRNTWVPWLWVRSLWFRSGRVPEDPTDYELLHQKPRLPQLGSPLYRCQATTNHYLAQKFSQSTKHSMTFSMLKKFYLTTKTKWDSFYWQKPATDTFGGNTILTFPKTCWNLKIIELDGNSLWGKCQ